MNEKAKDSICNKRAALSGRTRAAGVSMYYQYNPGFDVDGDLVCAFFSGLRAEEADAEFRSIVVAVVIVGVVLLAATMLVGLWVIRRMIDRPIRQAERLASEMREGNLSAPDFEIRSSRDEIGVFLRNLQQTKHDVSSYIKDISAVIAQNSATAEETAASCEELASQSNLLKTQVNMFKV